MLCCGYTLTDFPISIRLTSLALWQSNDCPSASKATLMNMDKYFMWIHYERLHNHNKAKHNKTVCIFLGIYCIYRLYRFTQLRNILITDIKYTEFRYWRCVSMWAFAMVVFINTDLDDKKIIWNYIKTNGIIMALCLIGVKPSLEVDDHYWIRCWLDTTPVPSH